MIVSDWSGEEGGLPHGLDGCPVILTGDPHLSGGAFLSLLDSFFSCVGLSLYVIMTCGPSLVIS
jgi:hypothetical protein